MYAILFLKLYMKVQNVVHNNLGKKNIKKIPNDQNAFRSLMYCPLMITLIYT